MIFIAGIAISLFLCVLLLTKKNKGIPDQILSAWMLFITLHQLYFYFDHSPYFRQYPGLIGFDFPLPLMHGPFLFLYASSLVDRLPAKKWMPFLHFIPAIMCLVCMSGFFSLPAEEKYYIIDNEGVGYTTFLMIRSLAIMASGVVYVALTLFLLFRHQQRIRDNFSDIEKVNLKWLQYLTVGISLIWIAVIFGTEELTFSIVVVFVLFIGIYGIRQTPIFTAVHATIPGALPEEPGSVNNSATNIPVVEETTDNTTKYKKSGLSEADRTLIADQLQKLMESEHLFTQPDITLGEVARKLDIHSNYLSEVINSRFNKNFYDYINAQRVTAFLSLVSDPKQRQYTLLALAFQCGFNSKSSFNRNFKKATGDTPSEYLQRMHVTLKEEE